MTTAHQATTKIRMGLPGALVLSGKPLAEESSLAHRIGAWVAAWFSLVVVVAVLIPVTWFQPYKNGPAIRADGLGYHLWTRAILQGDYYFKNYWGQQGILYHPERKISQNKYPPGVAILRMPVMMFLARPNQKVPLITDSEHRASLMISALALAGMCWLLVRSCQMLDCGRWATHTAVLSVVFGTGLFHYSTYDGSFSHVYSCLLVAWLLYFGIKAVVEQTRLSLWCLLLCALCVLVRNTNVFILGVMTLCHAFFRYRRSGFREQPWLRDAGIIFFGTLAGIAVQVTYNSLGQERFAISSYATESFKGTSYLSVLWSYERGLFFYYPILALVLIVAWCKRPARGLALAVTVLIAAFTLTYGAWHDWCLGWGFGHRGFLEMLPLVIVAFAVGLSALSSRGFAMAVTAATLCAIVTLNMMVGYWQNVLPMHEVDRSTYLSFLYGRNAMFQYLNR